MIKTSAAIPGKGVRVSKQLDEQTSDVVMQALIALERKNPGHARILALIDPEYSGFAAASDEEYAGTRPSGKNRRALNPRYSGAAEHQKGTGGICRARST